MKRTLPFIVLLLFVSLAIQGQVYVSEDFSGDNFPPSGWSISANTTNWSAVGTSHAGGQAPEVRLAWNPQFNGASRLQLPAIDLSENMSGKVIFSFDHAVDHYGNTFTLGLAYRIGTGDWVNVWTQTVNSSIAGQRKTIILEDFPTQAEELQFALFFQGNSYNLNYWYIDNILVMAPQETDLALQELDIPFVLQEEDYLSGTVINAGTSLVHSFDLNWSINGGPEQTQSFFGLELGLYEAFNFQAHTMLPSETGNYSIEAYISNVNEHALDDNQENDHISQSFVVPTQLSAKRPLFESFTSSTCPPCYSFNTSFFNNFISTNKENLSIIKYQMSWPGSGDPYYTAEGGVRRTYYSVSGVPSLIVNGTMIPTNGSAVNIAFNEALEEKTVVDLIGVYRTQDDLIHIEGSVLPYAGIDDLTLHVVVLENTTYGNTGSNGETEFHHVMMKMLPDANGLTHSFADGEEYRFDHSFDMSSTNVEEMEDLSVIVFIQDNGTKELIQSANLDKTTDGAPVASSNIADGEQGVSVWKDIEILYNQIVTLPPGKTITNTDLQNIISFHVAGEPENTVAFTAQVNEFGNMFTITPTDYLSPLTTYTLSVEPVEGYWGVLSELFSFTFTTREALEAPVVTFSPEDGSEITQLYAPLHIHFDQQVRHADGDFFTHEQLQQAITLEASGNGNKSTGFTAHMNSNHTAIEIVPTENLSVSSQYTLSIAAVMGEDGVMNSPAQAVFSTRPSIGAPVAWYNIADNATDIDLTPTFRIVFSQPVRAEDGSEITEENIGNILHLFRDNLEGELVALNITINANKNIIDFYPVDKLPGNTTFVISVAPLLGTEEDLTPEMTRTFTTRQTAGAPVATFSIEDGETDVSVDVVATIELNQAVRQADGSEITDDDLSQLIMFYETNEEGNAVSFSATINSEKNLITVTPSGELAIDQLYMLGIDELLGTDDELSDPAHITFTTVESLLAGGWEYGDFQVFPNPASNRVHVSLPGEVAGATLRIIDHTGKIISTAIITGNSVEMNLQELSDGLYFIDVVSENFKARKKLLIAR